MTDTEQTPRKGPDRAALMHELQETIAEHMLTNTGWTASTLAERLANWTIIAGRNMRWRHEHYTELHNRQAELREQIANLHPEAVARRLRHHDLLLAACKAALAAMEAELEADDPQARSQMEWEAEPLAMLREAIAEAEAA
jgi:hypothetical protein